MSKKIGCDICYTPLGSIEAGSKLKKGMKTVCESCFDIVEMEIRKQVGKKKQGNSDVFDVFSDMFGKI